MKGPQALSFRLGLVPHDERPVSLDQVVRQVEVAGGEVLVPPREWLGHRSEAGDAAALRGWLRDHRHDADAWVLSLDMLVFGGLVASREPSLDEARAAACVEEVWGALAEVSGEAVYAYMALRRLAPTAGRAEDLGAWRAGHEGALDRAARQPNVAAARAAVRGAPGVLALLQEDARPDSALAAEQTGLLAGAGPGVVLAPGTDEGPRALAVRALAEHAELASPSCAAPAVGVLPPLRAIQNCLSGELAGRGRDRARARIAPYEDRPLGDTLAGQLAVAGLVEDPGADAKLFVWAPDRPGRDLWLDPAGEAAPDQEASVFIAAVAAALAVGHRVVVADVADANGADPALWRLPEASALLSRLHGFAAWNTAGNTLGCALAQLRLPRDPTGLALRVAEDWGFQTEVRPAATRWARGERNADPWNLESTDRARVETFAEERLRRWWGETFRAGTWPFRPGHLHLPWSRLFEASIDMDQAPA